MNNRSGTIRRRGLLRAALPLALLLVCPALPQAHAQAILALDVIEPRAFGYVIGDKVRREVHLSLDADYRLDEASLPKAGRLDRWLELAAPEVRVESIRNGHRYSLIFTYQIVNAPRAVETVTIPQQNLGIVGDTHAITGLVPALRLTVAPITPGTGTDPFGVSLLQPDRPPAPMPVQARQRRLAWIVAGLLTLLSFAACRRWLMAFIGGRNLPFARAVRELRRSQPAAGTPAQYAAGLRIVHEAVNETAGRAVFAHNLDDFLAAHPLYAGLRADFAGVFAASRQVFFANAAAARSSQSGWPALLGLCQRCSRLERRALRLRS